MLAGEFPKSLETEILDDLIVVEGAAISLELPSLVFGGTVVVSQCGGLSWILRSCVMLLVIGLYL